MKVTHQHCKGQFHNSGCKCAFRTNSSSGSKRDVLKIIPFVVNIDVNESLKIKPPWFNPIIWISSN